jgi:hypothetical protein
LPAPAFNLAKQGTVMQAAQVSLASGLAQVPGAGSEEPGSMATAVSAIGTSMLGGGRDAGVKVERERSRALLEDW